MFLTPLSSNSWFFRAICRRAVFSRLAFVFSAGATRDRRSLIVSLWQSLQIAASNQIQVTSHKNLNKNAAHIPHFYWKYLWSQMDHHRTRQTGLTDQSYFLAVIYRRVYKKYDSFMVRKTKLSALQKFGSHEAALKLLWRLARFRQSAKICKVFETEGRSYFTLLVNRFTTHTNKICFSVTRAIYTF